MRLIPGLFALLILISCSHENQEEKTETNASVLPITVEYAGALKNIMHKGDVSAHADLNDFEGVEHFYALGAVEGLKGEILVLDGTSYISSVQEEQLNIDNSFGYDASLLVHTTVRNWDEHAISYDVNSYNDLEDFIAVTAKQNGIDVKKPFPFLIKGACETLTWHVINWPEGDAIHTHEKHTRSGQHGVHENIDVEILGFYSDSHHAIFTHHTTNMHLHFISNDKTKTGHVDDLTLGPGMTLLLPKTTQK